MVDEENERKKGLPIAVGKPTQHQPVAPRELTELLKPFVGASTGQCYFGPSGISEDQIPWLVVVTQGDKLPRMYREAGSIGLLGWRWNVAPSCPFTLTVMGLKEPRPYARWMAGSEEPVVQAFRHLGKFRVCLAHPTGSRSGWFEAIFPSGGNRDSSRTLSEVLEAQFAFPAPGIPYSKVGERYEPFKEDERDEENEICLWPDPVGDAWKTLDLKGPWSDDLEPRDKKIADWASLFHHKRARAAGFIQMIKERQEFDGVTSVVDAEGQWVAANAKPELDALLQQHPILQAWIVALAGPSPDAKAAHEAAFATLHSPESIYAFAAKFVSCIRTSDDPEFVHALQFSYEAALLDNRITELGHKRPWLKNTGLSRLELCAITLDPSCPREDLETLWRSGLEFGDLLDAGEWFGPRDLPAPLDIVNETLRTVRLEGSVEGATERVEQLLREAQDARQWSIPWGARVQIQFGPFVALRIFEKEGEFSCHFLDERDRYLHVAIGLGQGAPRISAIALLFRPDDSGEMLWNDAAEVSLQLIAAAIVRDFLVVEERDSVFSARPMRKRIAGHNTNSIIYLPRVRYNRPRSDQVVATDSSDQHRPRHSVSQHLRRVGSASAAQRFLAQRYGVALPEGFTFVRPHERGTNAEEERIHVYRSRSASHMIFEEIAEVPEGTRPAWFEFEKACALLLKREGMKVIHQAAQRDGDGGVDLFAVDTDGNSWVVQCKCWATHRSIGPEVVRELVGAIARADRGAIRSSRGIIITTTSFTSGAVSEAIAEGFRIIDGSLFAKMVQGI